MASGQAPPQNAPAQPADTPAAPDKVEVEPTARDEEIEQRLLGILEATGWFTEPRVEVNEGVVFFEGNTHDERYQQWAGDLARNTRDVVAVVNRIEVLDPVGWNFQPALDEFRSLRRNAVQLLPIVVVGVLIVVAAWFGGLLTARVLRRQTGKRIGSPLLREVVARAAGLLVLLLGIYLALRIAGLTRLAVTVVGGTGLVGLVIGIAFRDITENFLASIFLSMQQPFRAGDLVEINQVLGVVQRVNIRTTILMTLSGNHVQIPNATVYKSTIRNFSSNPNRREDFTVGIGYDDRIPFAQEIALGVLADHPAVLKEPEPWVLVDNLGPSTVNLKVYFWLNGQEHSWLKVRSSVIRLIKRAFQDAGISMPDESRELVFPRGVPVEIREGNAPPVPEHAPTAPAAAAKPEAIATAAERGLHSESQDIEQQARSSRQPEEGPDLLQSSR